MEDQTFRIRTKFTPGRIVFIICVVCILAFIAVCIFMGKQNKNRYDHLDRVIDAGEMQIVQDAVDASGVTFENDVRSHMTLLFDAIWYYGTETIDIVSAEVIPFVNEGIEWRPGHPIEGYAIKVMDVEGNEFIVWDSEGFQRVLKNGENILFQGREYDIDIG